MNMLNTIHYHQCFKQSGSCNFVPIYVIYVLSSKQETIYHETEIY
jgi:hypothetical protein